MDQTDHTDYTWKLTKSFTIDLVFLPFDPFDSFDPFHHLLMPAWRGVNALYRTAAHALCTSSLAFCAAATGIGR